LAGALALTTIKGLGPKVAAMLAERGITRVDEVAALTPDQARDLDVQLGAFTGRMARDRWIDQAKLLASGDTAAYEAEFGKLG
jgi:predicted flap endonuclease-1-like 5' DNA nuclease